MKVPVGADVPGRLVKRYKRFFADVETQSGEVLTVHCPNPGSMRGLLEIGAPVWCSTSDNPKRKLKHTLEMIQIGRVWVGLHTLRANQIAALALREGGIRSLSDYPTLRAEVRVDEQSRLDFGLSDHPSDPRPAFVEVKSVTMAEGSEARFPDSVTERGRKHAETLGSLVADGNRAVLLFVVQRGDCDRVAPASEIDPAYADALYRAAEKGVEILALGTEVAPEAIRITTELPVRL